MRPPASVVSNHPGVRVWSSSASRSMVARIIGRGGAVPVPAASPGRPVEGVLAQAQQPVGHRATVLPSHRTTPGIELVERVLGRVRITQVVRGSDGRPERGVECFGQGGEPDRVVLAVDAAAPEQVGLQRQEPVPFGGSLGLLQAGRLLVVDPLPRVGDERVGLPVAVGHHGPADQVVQLAPSPDRHTPRGTTDRRGLRPRQPPVGQPGQRRRHVAQHVDRSEDLACLDAGAPRLVLQPDLQRHATGVLGQISSVRDAATSNATSRPISRSRRSAMAATSSSHPATGPDTAVGVTA